MSATAFVIEPAQVAPGSTFARVRFDASLRRERPHFYKFIKTFASMTSVTGAGASADGDVVIDEGGVRRLAICVSHLASSGWPILTSSLTSAYVKTTLETMISLDIFDREVVVKGSAGETAFALEMISKRMRALGSPGVRELDVVRSDAGRLAALPRDQFPLAFMPAEDVADARKSMLVFGATLFLQQPFFAPGGGGADGADAAHLRSATAGLTTNNLKEGHNVRAFVLRAQTSFAFLDFATSSHDVSAAESALALLAADPAAALRFYADNVLMRFPRLLRILSKGSGDAPTLDDADVGSRLQQLHALLQPKVPLTLSALAALEVAATSTTATTFESWCAESQTFNDEVAAGKQGAATLRALLSHDAYKRFAEVADGQTDDATVVAFALAAKLVVLRLIVANGLAPQIAKKAASVTPLATLAAARSAVFRAANLIMLENERITPSIVPTEVPADLVRGLLTGEFPTEILAYAEVVRRFCRHEFAHVETAFGQTNAVILGMPEVRPRVLDLIRGVVGPLFLNFGYDGMDLWLDRVNDCAKSADFRPGLKQLVVAAFNAGFQDAQASAKHSLDGVLADARFDATFAGPRFKEAVESFGRAKEKLLVLADYVEVSGLAPVPSPFGGLYPAAMPPVGLAAQLLPQSSGWLPPPPAPNSWGAPPQPTTWSMSQAAGPLHLGSSSVAPGAWGAGPSQMSGSFGSPPPPPPGPPPPPWQPPSVLLHGQQPPKKQRKSSARIDGGQGAGKSAGGSARPTASRQLPDGSNILEIYKDKNGNDLVRVGVNVFEKSVVDTYTSDGCYVPFVARGAVGALDTPNSWWGPIRQGLCPCPTAPGHESWDSEFHKPPTALYNQLRIDFVKAPASGFADMPPKPKDGQKGFRRPARN